MLYFQYRKVSEVSEVVDENVRNVTTILETEENLGIMQEVPEVPQLLMKM